MSVVVVAKSSQGVESLRVEALRDVLTRLAKISNSSPEASACAAEDFQALLTTLSKKGLIRLVPQTVNSDFVDVFYSPSRPSRQELLAEVTRWPDKVAKKQRAKVRATPGAIFRFPIVGESGFVECFITDWSPFPAAAAIAVYRGHPLSFAERGVVATGFTGKFVRHPLHGDLLPVWVAGWVKPNFGTGAVIINPAHSDADLAYAREVGLPIRFGLVMAEPTTAADSWPSPPVVKSGIAFRTGIADGMSYDAAAANYIGKLIQAGAAEMTTDVGLPWLKIGAIGWAGSGASVDYSYKNQSVTGAVEPTPPNAQRGVFAPENILTVFLATASGAVEQVVCGAWEVDDALLYLRTFLHDMEAPVPSAGKIHVVQKIDMAAGSSLTKPEDIKLASLLAADFSEIAVIKQQQADQIARFHKLHGEITGRTLAARGAEPSKFNKQFARVRQQLEAGKMRDAIATFLTAQKSLAAELNEQSSLQDLAGYYAASHVLYGTEVPGELDLNSTWLSLS